ncbi:MAG TPA: hypothetical protein ENK31_01810, partial [Nannocystis exedens]|nr:hypothetical protein [Nannocystis exedens]
MKKTSLMLLASLLASCGSPSPADKKASADVVADAKDKNKNKTPEPVAAKAEVEQPKDNRVLADSGLGIGGKLRAFQITNSDSGEEYCQVCRYGGSPKIMAVGSVDDPDFRNDLQNIDAVVQKYGEDKLKAFGVIAEIKDGRGLTPKEHREELIARVKTMRDELGITIPVVLPAIEDDGANAAFDNYYNITKSRTLMFADGRNSIRFSAVAPSDLSGLNTAIKEVLG